MNPLVIIFAPFSISSASLGICGASVPICEKSIDVEKENCSQSCPPMVWVCPVGSKVTSSLGGAGAAATRASSCAASNT